MSTIPHNGTPTSISAADSIRDHVETMRRKVAAFIASRGAAGATDEECQVALGMPGSTQRPRRGEVWGFGLITDQAGERRATTSGRSAVVWHVTLAGLRAVGLPETAFAADKPPLVSVAPVNLA